MLALLVFVISVSHPLLSPLTGQGKLTVGQMTFSVVVCVALALRRRWPVAVLAVSAAATAVSVALNEARGLSTLVVVVAVYTVAARTNRVISVLAGASTALILVVSLLLSG